MLASGDNIANLRTRSVTSAHKFSVWRETPIGETAMMRQIQSKKIQTIPQNSQELFLAKCFVEQQLEQTQKGSTQISLKGNHDDGSSVLFRVAKTKEIAAVAKGSKLYVFAKPLKEFKGLPLDTKVVSLGNIVKTDGVMRCTKCKSWVNNADVTKCPCGGYLQKRKRFHARGETTKSLDAEYLEVQSALDDIRISAGMDSKPRRKRPTATGIITPSMAGMSSVEQPPVTTYAGFLTAVVVKCAGKQPEFDQESKTKHTHLQDNRKYAFFKEMGADVESIQSHEIKEFVKLDAQRIAGMAVESWDDAIPRDAEMHPAGQKQSSWNSSVPKDAEGGRRPNSRKQMHSTTQKRYKRNPERIAKQKRVATCSTCGNKTPALVESKCTKCFLKVAN